MSTFKCAQCGVIATKHCSRCRSIHYCGVICQKEGWSDHKKNCAPKETMEKKTEEKEKKNHQNQMEDKVEVRRSILDRVGSQKEHEAEFPQGENPPIASWDRPVVDYEVGEERIVLHGEEAWNILFGRPDVSQILVLQRCNGYITYLRYYLTLKSFPDRFYEMVENGIWPLKHLGQSSPRFVQGNWRSEFVQGSTYTHSQSGIQFRATQIITGKWLFHPISEPVVMSAPGVPCEHQLCGIPGFHVCSQCGRATFCSLSCEKESQTYGSHRCK